MRVAALLIAAMLAGGCTVLMIGDGNVGPVEIQLETDKKAKAPLTGPRLPSPPPASDSMPMP